MILWLFYGRNFKEKYQGSPRILRTKSSEDFYRNPNRRNESTRVSPKIPKPISFKLKYMIFFG